MKINLNTQVKVKLTELGEAYYKKFLWENEFSGYEPDDKGYLHFPLWEVMQIFGPLCEMGGAPFFENNEFIMELPDNQKLIEIHYLTENSTDLPQPGETVLDEAGSTLLYDDYKWQYVSSDGELFDCKKAPNLWYYPPKFDTETIKRKKLEKLSKEELIEMILSKDN